MQPKSWGPSPSHELGRRASDLPPGCMETRALNMPRDFTGGHRANAVSGPDDEVSLARLPACRETALPCLQGGLGVQRAPLPPWCRQ